MLSLKTVRPSQSAHYYARDNSQSIDRDAIIASLWGKGAEQIGLEQVNAQQLSALLYGEDLEGKPLTQKPPVSGHKRAALDVTGSPPKSWSLAVLIGGKDELRTSHEKAITALLGYAEQNLAETRVWDSDERKRVQTGNLLAAIQEHATSRLLDPQLHSHCLLINSTEYKGKRYSLANEPIFKQAKFLQLVYTNELALATKQLGYEINHGPNGQMELAGYTPEQLQAFSKRTNQIIDLVGEKASPQVKKMACLTTRPDKNETKTLEELKEEWQIEAAGLDIVHPEPTLTQQIAHDPEAMKAAIDAAIEHCSERRVDFSREEILTFILQENLGKYSMDELLPEVESHPELLDTIEGKYTTIAATLREIQTLEMLHEGMGKFQPLATPVQVEEVLEQNTLTNEQSEAIKEFATSHDQYYAWNGVGGAGKSYGLQSLVELMMPEIERGNTSIRVMAPLGKAAKELGEALGLEGVTIDSFLNKREPPGPNEIWIVDEGGMTSARLGHELQVAAQRYQARVLVLGDLRQLSSVESGSWMRSLLAGGIERSYLQKSQRQKVASLKHAVDLAADGKHLMSLRHFQIDKRISIQPDAHDRHQQVSQDYLSLSPEERKSTLVLAGTHRERQAITATIRTGLKAEGVLGTETKDIKVLKTKDLTQVQARYCHNYEVGNILTPTRAYPAQGLEKFQPYQVIEVNQDNLLVADQSGKKHWVNPQKFRKQVYSTETIEVAVGDSLKSTKRQGKRQNRDMATVTAISDESITITDHKGKEQILSLADYHHLDYSLVETVHAAQGATADQVLYSLTADQTVAAESYYVGVSRAKYDLKLYVEDIDHLTDQLLVSKAQRNPLELLDANLAKTIGLEYKPHRVSHKEQELNFTPFYDPNPAASASPAGNLQPHHWDELVNGSAIDPELAILNCESIVGDEVLDRLLSTKLEGLGSGQYVTKPMARIMERYEKIAEGGWWAGAGVQALSLPSLKPGQTPDMNLWGSYKPDAPREDVEKTAAKGKPQVRKYEHPLGEKRSLFLPQVPDALAEKVYAKHNITPKTEDKDRGFWFVVLKHNLPITIAEGAKKTLASLSQGEVTIGLSGVNGGYQSRDEAGNKLIERQLHPELAVFATLGREFRFAFDKDTKLTTVLNVRRDMVRTGELLQKAGCVPKVLNWQQDKGVDDLIKNQGPVAYSLAQGAAVPLSVESKRHYRNQYLRLAKQVLEASPELSIEQVDKQVLRLAVARGDIWDGARFLSQSDTARSIERESGREAMQQYLQEFGAVPRQEKVRVKEAELER